MLQRNDPVRQILCGAIHSGRSAAKRRKLRVIFNELLVNVSISWREVGNDVTRVAKASTVQTRDLELSLIEYLRERFSGYFFNDFSEQVIIRLVITEPLAGRRIHGQRLQLRPELLFVHSVRQSVRHRIENIENVRQS